MARPDLDVWVITGDGDGLSIGGNHLIHALRRNVNLTILLFNNQIYGLTKGQYSPTSELGKVTKSTPFGSLDHPFNPLSLALGAEATFVARTHDMDRKHMSEMFQPRARAQGRRVRRDLPELQRLQRRRVRPRSLAKEARPDMLIPLVHGEPIRFGADGRTRRRARRAGPGPHRRRRRRRRRRDPRARRGTRRAGAGVHAVAPGRRGPHEPTPIGVFRAVERPDYGDEVDRQLAAARERQGPGDLSTLLRSGGTWEV